MRHVVCHRRGILRSGFTAAPLVGLLLLLVSGGGCDNGDSNRGTRTAPRPTTAPTTAPVALDPGRPGVLTYYFAKGRVLGQDGQPITAPDARIEVMVHGFDQKGDDITLTPKPDADGYYVQQLPEGTYRPVIAHVEVPFRGRDYTFTLEPKVETSRPWEASEGMLQDFTWKLTGLRPGQREDKSHPEPWYGGSITAKYHAFREDLDRTVPSPPANAKVIFTLTPEGDAIDGKPAQTRTFEREYDLLIGLHEPLLQDLPIAWYRIQAQEIHPDGRRLTLLFLDHGKWTDSTAGTWEPDPENKDNGVLPVTVDFTRPTRPGL